MKILDESESEDEIRDVTYQVPIPCGTFVYPRSAPNLADIIFTHLALKQREIDLKLENRHCLKTGRLHLCMGLYSFVERY